ncbi:conserved protein of unknown function [Candidatus Hydrogenisulfobacillus filiaventi]|uniref:Uncharacterized protein n=1 Tax=Candidatus Hydrogenisulfobacillus filiaventi TaxID=2707344 RepID=A0A6F8ZIX7_9FIRM|nr:conserved protein of unknown function [Candidatus Hydrogenisulfobacillus filiaventi]
MILNLTPHALQLRKADGSVLTLPPSGRIARVAAQDVVEGEIEGLLLHRMTLGQEITDLPAPEPGVVYVASLLAAQAAVAMGRSDVFAPGPAIRDADGRIVGADGLSRP